MPGFLESGGVNRPDITTLLRAWGEGDDSALDRLAPMVYDELHSIAHQISGKRRDKRLNRRW
jgi:hypothetical protein